MSCRLKAWTTSIYFAEDTLDFLTDHRSCSRPQDGRTRGRPRRASERPHTLRRDLDRSIAFIAMPSADAAASPEFPSGSSRELGALTRAPGATVRATTLQVPGGDVRLTLVQFSGVDARPVRQRLQDPGSVKLVLRVKDMDAAFARVHDRLAGVYTEGGAPIRPEGPAAVNRAVIMRDPDGYPLEFAFQGGPVAADVPASSIVIGGWATFIVGDVDRTLEFYRDHLGFLPTGQPTPLSPAVLSLQGTPTAAGSMSAGASSTMRNVPPLTGFTLTARATGCGRPLQDPGTPAVSFLVDNVPALLARLGAAGVTVDTGGGEAVSRRQAARVHPRPERPADRARRGRVMQRIACILGITGLVVVLSGPGLGSQTGTPVAPVFKVDPFWPRWLPNRWSMQQVTGIGIDPQNDHIWFINRAAAANPDEIGGDLNKIDC
jgi:catechol 2,3-dioxygenase-like lactoylglutathione lyase family enzyme